LGITDGNQNKVNQWVDAIEIQISFNYHIYTVRDITDYAGGSIPEEVNSFEEYFNADLLAKDDPYYAVYATFKMDIPRGPIKIFETPDLKVAVYVVEQLTGNKVKEDEVYN
jgi:hypothetical protein